MTVRTPLVMVAGAIQQLQSGDTLSGVPYVYSGTTDPGSANDNTQGYGAGSMGINTDTGEYTERVS